MYTLIVTAKLNDIGPHWLADVRARNGRLGLAAVDAIPSAGIVECGDVGGRNEPQRLHAALGDGLAPGTTAFVQRNAPIFLARQRG